MRTLAAEELKARQQKILQAVVHLYIKTGKPVGSSSILENFKLSLSPATVRNVLSDLEKSGFLTHPHTSAGRVPTDHGYRVYVDTIANIQRLALEEEMRIKLEYTNRLKEMDDLLLSTTKILSALSNCTGFVTPPKLVKDKLRRIELVPVDGNRVLAILVSSTGFVQNQMIDVKEIPRESDLRAVSAFLNERLSGLDFEVAREKMATEIYQYQLRQLEQREFLKGISKALFEEVQKDKFYVEGTSNLLNFPEFQDYESMKNFAAIVDKKELLHKVLTKELNKKGIQVRIGKETSPQLKDFSIVSTNYAVGGRPVGVLGILGPKRMPYARMMAIVDSVADLVSDVLDSQRGENSLVVRGRRIT